MRYRYNRQVRPPAQVVHVTVGRPDEAATSLEVPVQLDTAADISALPALVVETLALVPFDSLKVAGFGGLLRNLPTFLVRLAIGGFQPVMVEVVAATDEPYILLGRDVLNGHRILLDGPNGVMEIG